MVICPREALNTIPPLTDDQRIQKGAMALSFWAGILMLGIKLGAYWLTGSAAILSDASESVVHVVAVSFAAYSLSVTFRPADAGHLYGHAKISFFSAGFEGAMIILAALYIIASAIEKWMHGLVLENLGLGTLLTLLAALINGSLGWFLLRMGKRKQSLVLEANGRHVLTDCWTSLGVLAGLGLTLTTGWLPWDPIIALLVAGNILFSGINLVRKSVGGLMDVADPTFHQQLVDILDRETRRHDIEYHDLRHRNLGNSYWVEVHFLFAGATALCEAHRIATEIEEKIEEALAPPVHVVTHLESIEDHHAIHARSPHSRRPASPGA